MKNFMTLLLLAAYAGSAVWGICHPYDKFAGLIALTTISTIITAPYFVFNFLGGMIGGLIITTILLAISIIFPPLFFLVGLWMLLSIFSKFALFLKNIPFIFAGCLLFGGLHYGVILLLHIFSVSGFPWLAGIISAVIALAAFGGVLKIAQAMEYEVSSTAAMALGFPSYLILFAIGLFMMGHGDGGMHIGGHGNEDSGGGGDDSRH